MEKNKAGIYKHVDQFIITAEITLIKGKRKVEDRQILGLLTMF
jgi:hypothetical protein